MPEVNCLKKEVILMAYSKYKDATPEATVERIKGIYKQRLGLELELKVAKRIDGIFSATLTDKSAMWNTCGKGTTEAFCSASAYGESVEHLCNYFAYEIANLANESERAYGFEKYPDEQIKDLSEIKNELPDMLHDMREAYGLVSGKKTSDEALIELWKKMLRRNDVPFVPYYSVKEKKYRLVPENMIFYLCGSNGGGAGNTPEEAIGHACDEIMERYVKYDIYMKGLTPPTVPIDHIKTRCPDLASVIEDLEANNGYKIIVKDASMGKGYSVMSVLMINQNTAEYLVNFGAHPRFEIALERCLTEMLQAFVPRKHNHRKNMEKWTSLAQKRSKYAQNWVTLLKDDSGVVPDTYFYENPSWKFEPWPYYEEYTNKLGMTIQIKQLLNIAPDVLIHDSSYLGFPSYRVYVPTVSTSHIPFDEFQLKCYEMMPVFAEKAEQKKFTLNDIEEVEKTLFSKDTFVNGLMFRSLGESRFHLLHAAAYFDMHRYDDAIDYLELARSKYSECLIRLINMLQEGETAESDIRSALQLFYKKETVFLALSWLDSGAFISTLQLFEDLGISFSPRVFMKKELVDNTNKLHISLKKAMLESDRVDNLPVVFAEINV